MRVSKLEGSVIPKTVAAAIAEAGGCPESEVRTGSVRRIPSGPGSIWVRLPLSAAVKVVDAGRLKVGWA
ncbi:gag-pol polyprotein [Lasius niger]|uniref:Gag-pol polyprotein n=1 Tax=Lasius niger TaxID=67767 RepID=A0A0J7KHG4_LASNI|nr:gag-pol polyprotein [Lasius niger]